jgi:hypothetical protein
MVMTENVSTRSGTREFPARLEMLPARTGPHRVDGTWWPRSADLGRELTGLVAALEDRWPGITRVTVSGDRWLPGPESVVVGGREVHVNRLRASPEPGTICLLSYGVGRCDLLVAAPGSEP